MDKYRQVIIDIFLERVKKQDEREGRSPQSITVVKYYYNDVGTSEIAAKLGIKTDKARRELKKLEALGLVKANRSYLNYTRWTTDIPGYKDYKYAGYSCRE